MRTLRARKIVGELLAAVNGDQKMDIEGFRPARRTECGVCARGGDGRLRLHGHGTRERQVWGPAHATGRPGYWVLRVRRFRCTFCKKVRTALAPQIALRYRYSISVIGLAFLLWAVWGRCSAAVRRELAPMAIFGECERHTWRSLPRWASRALRLFRLDIDLEALKPRDVARRVARLLIARAPPDLHERERVFAGAHAP